MFNKKISKKLIKFNMVLSRNFLVIPLIISSILYRPGYIYHLTIQWIKFPSPFGFFFFNNFVIKTKWKKKKKIRGNDVVSLPLKIKTKNPTPPITLIDFWENNWQNSERSRGGKEERERERESENGGEGEILLLLKINFHSLLLRNYSKL